MKLMTDATLSDYVRNAPGQEAHEYDTALDLALQEAGLTATPATDAPTEDVTVKVTGKRLLSFTVVYGWVRGDHRCPFELHATGCRDLKKLLRTKQFSYEVLASTRDEANAAAIAEHGAGQVWEQPCCLLKRMQAIGRA